MGRKLCAHRVLLWDLASARLRRPNRHDACTRTDRFYHRTAPVDAFNVERVGHSFDGLGPSNRVLTAFIGELLLDGRLLNSAGLKAFSLQGQEAGCTWEAGEACLRPWQASARSRRGGDESSQVCTGSQAGCGPCDGFPGAPAKKPSVGGCAKASKEWPTSFGWLWQIRCAQNRLSRRRGSDRSSRGHGGWQRCRRRPCCGRRPAGLNYVSLGSSGRKRQAYAALPLNSRTWAPARNLSK